MKLVLLCLASLFCAFGQNSGCEATRSCSSVYFYSNGNLAYVCSAPFQVSTTTFNGAGIVVSGGIGTATIVGPHDLWAGATISVAGAAAVNGNYSVATIPSTTTFTFLAPGVPNGTYNGVNITTQAPTLSATVWRIQVFKYQSGTSNLDTSSLANGLKSYNYQMKCSDRTLY